MLRFSPKRTMMLAQKLYEGVEMGGKKGLGSHYLHEDRFGAGLHGGGKRRPGVIGETFGKEYLPKTPHFFKNKKAAQDAHEAIRPAEVLMTPEKVKPFSTKTFSPSTILYGNGSSLLRCLGKG